MDLNIGAALWFAAGACGRCIVRGPAGPASAPSSSSSSSRIAGLSDQEASCLPPHLQATLGGPDGSTGPSGSEASPNQRGLEGLWRCTAKAMLVGQGADEAFGGYGRYRTRFREAVRRCMLGLLLAHALAVAGSLLRLVSELSKPGTSADCRHTASASCSCLSRAAAQNVDLCVADALQLQGWQGLQDEMAADMRRLWLRNLGRDDRILSDHGREARHPFLHVPLQALVLGLPLPHLADFSQVQDRSWLGSHACTKDD